MSVPYSGPSGYRIKTLKKKIEFLPKILYEILSCRRVLTMFHTSTVSSPTAVTGMPVAKQQSAVAQ
jgi:hypothetical protein